MKLLNHEQFEVFGGNNAEHTFRTSSWIMLIPSGLLFAICGGLFWGMNQNVISTFYWVAILLLLPIATLSFVCSFLPTLSIQNWALKIKGRNIYVALNVPQRRFCKTKDLRFAFFTLSDIAAVREYHRLTHLRGTENGEQACRKERYLEFEFKDTIPTNVREAIYIENRKRPANLKLAVKNRSSNSSVLIDENKLRILWNGRNESVRPSLQKALTIISAFDRSKPELVGESKCPDEMLDDEFEEFLIELYENGDRISAVKSLCDQRGLSITDAVTKIESLAESQSSLEKHQI